jgi:flagellin
VEKQLPDSKGKATVPLNSVNTNVGAMIALESLNATNMSLQATQKQISTGYRVADATDDGAAFAVAQGLRSNVAGLTAATQQLQATAGLMTATTDGLTSVSQTMSKVQALLVTLSGNNISSTQRTQDQNQLTQYANNIKNYITDSTYQGKSLINSFGTAASTGYGSVSFVRNEQGSLISVATTNASAIYHALSTLESATSTQAAAALTATGSFTTQMTNLGNAINKYGNATNYISAQVTYNNNRIDAMNAGLGALVDADLSKEAANLQALQTRQQLGTQALSMANQAPNSLLSLFR